MLIYKIVSIFSYILFFPVFIIFSIILLIISCIHLPLFYRLDKFVCRVIMTTFFIWPKVIGTFPKDGTYIIMMNHSSFLDVFLFPLIPRGRYSGLTAADNFKIPLFATLIKRIQAIPIDRGNLSSAIQSIKKAEYVLRQGIHIGILPEGTRTLTGLLSPLKKGGFHMAINAGASIVPVGISGAFTFKPKNRWWIVPGRITINIGNIIPIKNYSLENIEKLQHTVKKQLQSLSGEINENK